MNIKLNKINSNKSELCFENLYDFKKDKPKDCMILTAEISPDSITKARFILNKRQLEHLKNILNKNT